MRVSHLHCFNKIMVMFFSACRGGPVDFLKVTFGKGKEKKRNFVLLLDFKFNKAYSKHWSWEGICFMVYWFFIYFKVVFSSSVIKSRQLRQSEVFLLWSTVCIHKICFLNLTFHTLHHKYNFVKCIFYKNCVFV